MYEKFSSLLCRLRSTEKCLGCNMYVLSTNLQMLAYSCLNDHVLKMRVGSSVKLQLGDLYFVLPTPDDGRKPQETKSHGYQST